LNSTGTGINGELMPLINKIRKRDGKTVDFDREKVTEAIWKAAQSVGGKDRKIAEKLSENVVAVMEYQFSDKEIPTVEEIQDIVEKILIKNGHAKTAKAYILYRHQHTKIRDTKEVMVDAINIISEYIDQTDWRVRENSNEAFSFSGLLLHTAGKVMSNYNLSEMYTPAISNAHRRADVHIHDLSHGVIAYCCGHSLKNLMLRGFGGIPNKVDCKPAKHMSTVVHQMVNYIGCLQMEFAGAQAFSSVDTLLAPFVRYDNLTYRQVKQNMQQLVFSLNIPSRWGSQYPFSNLTFDWVAPEDMKNQHAIVGGKEQDHTYGEYGNEMDMVNKAFMEVLMEGDANGRTFTFPIPTYNLTKEFDWDGENSKLLFEMTAKYGAPYFQNYIGSGLDPRSIRAMCCRLNMDMNELVNRPGHVFAAGDSTGSIGVVTLNVNRYAYESKNREEFFDKVKHFMIIAKDSLEIKRRVIENNLKGGLMPYTRVYLGTFRNHFSTIGLCGMNEACLNLIGKDIASAEGKQLAIDTLKFMREMTREFQKETGNLFNVEATPAEGASYRLAREDKKIHPDIKTSGKRFPYLTNSTQLPVGHTDDIVEALEHQNDIQHLYTGGTVFHGFVGERLSSWDATRTIVKKIAHNTRIPYFTITPTFSVCPVHGYVKGEHYNCPVNKILK
jgi:ribonucleoside-triphosphate reductase